MVTRSSDNECSIGVKLLSEIIRVMSSAYMYFFDIVCGRSAVYILKRRGTSTDPWGTPFFKNLRLLFSSLRYNTKLRDEIIFIMKLTSDLSGITFVHACITKCTILH